jgi:uncharacterized membrane-anchored protein
VTRCRGSILLSLLAILVCGGLGAFAGASLAEVIGLGGTPGAIVAASIAMAVATLLWAAGVALLRVTGRLG